MLWVLATCILRTDNFTQFIGVLLFETFFRSRHPFIARGEKLTGILLPRIQRFLFLVGSEFGSFDHINRLIRRYSKDSPPFDPLQGSSVSCRPRAMR